MMPSISVIVPTHNRPQLLATCLAALAGQNYPADRYEVLIVDDGGSTNLVESVKPARLPEALRWLAIDKTGVSGARNHGVQAATGALLAFTDDDCAPDPGWLLALARDFLKRKDALLGGVTVNGDASDPRAEFAQQLVDVVTADSGEREPRFFPSCNIAVSREAFLSIGGFEEGFEVHAAEDRNFCSRWYAAGRPFHRVPDAKVSHNHSLGTVEFVAMYFRYARGAVQNSQLLATPVLGDVESRLSLRKLLRQQVIWNGEHSGVVSRFRGLYLYLLWELSSVCGFGYEALRRLFTAHLRSRLVPAGDDSAGRSRNAQDLQNVSNG